MYAFSISAASWRGHGPARSWPISAPTSSRWSGPAPATTPAAGGRRSSRTRAGAETREAGYYLSVNRGKRSITLELDKPEGQRVVRALAERSDIVLENFKVGTLARFGLGYEQLKAVNPRLIYCSITGFGQTGPRRDSRGLRLHDPGHGRPHERHRRARRQARRLARRRSACRSSTS